MTNETAVQVIPDSAPATVDMRDPVNWGANEWKAAIATQQLPGHVRSAFQALVIVATGRGYGLDPLESLRAIQMVKGNPTVKAGFVWAMIQRRYPKAELESDVTQERASLRFRKSPEDEWKTETFSLEDAKRAGLTGGNWPKYPRSMMFARAISRVGKFHFPDVMGGIWIEELAETVAMAKARTLGDL